MDPLVERARSGDAAALEQLLARLAPSIHRFGLRMCKNAEDANDVLQDALIAVAGNLGAFEGRSSLTSWAFALTRSACARRRRGAKNRPAASTDDIPERPDESRSPEELTSDRELGRALSSALDDLAEDYREVILLRDVEGLPAAEAAEVIGISVEALKSRLHRARSALREALRPVLEPAEAPAAGACPNVTEMFSKKLEGELSQNDCAGMEAHLEKCRRCAAACDALRSALLACKRVTDEEVPVEIQERVRAAIRELAPRG